jgi:TPR repeat protein
MIFSESRVQYNFSFLCIKKWYLRLIFSKIIILVVLLITSSETLGHSGKDIIGQFEKINSYFEVGLSYSDYVSMLRETNHILNGYMKTPEADKNKSRTSKIVTLYQLYAGFVKELFEMEVKGKHVIKKYIYKTESLQLKNPVFENYASVFPELIFIESEYLKEPFFYVSDLFQKSLRLAKNRTDLLVAQLTQKETSKNQVNDYSVSIPSEDGIWKVNKFETKEKSGDAGAYFDGEKIKLILYKRPTENKHEIKIITQGDQSWSKVSNDINLIAFSYTRPDPLVAFSNYPFSQLTVWSNIKFDLRDKYKIGSVALKINKSDIQKLKQNKELYILGWSKTDNIEEKGYSFVFRIPLKESSKTINEALFNVSNAEPLKNVSTTETIQKTRIGEEGDFESTLKKAEQGDSSAQNRIGEMFARGEGVVQDHKQSVYWLTKASEQGNISAQNYLGSIYFVGKIVPQDHKKAVYWWQKAAEQGDAAAQNNLGVSYANGEGVAEDHKQALYWYTKAAEQGDARAQNSLGASYANGEGVPQDYKQAVYWYTKAAEQGDAQAQYNLGLKCFYGQGVAQDHKQAVYWLQKAAEEGHAVAQFNLGAIYYNGEVVPQDHKKAVYWWQKAAEQGNTDAQHILGRM